MQVRVYQKPMRDMDELKQRLIGVQHSIIDQTVDQCWDRFNAGVKTNGEQFKRLMSWSVNSTCHDL